MKHASYIALAFWITCSVFVFAQTTATAEADKHESQTTTQLYLERCGNNFEILSDTMGVNFPPYITKAMVHIRNNWYNLIPAVARAPLMKQGKVSIEFNILRNGSVSEMKIAEPSGDTSLDRAAWAGITTSSPFSPLPNEFSGSSIRLLAHFYYNPGALVGICPSKNVVVKAGTSQLFVPQLTKAAGIKWAVSGSGCVGEVCGTISRNGLYTAPLTIPNPAFVNVSATLESDSTKTQSVKVTILGVQDCSGGDRQ